MYRWLIVFTLISTLVCTEAANCEQQRVGITAHLNPPSPYLQLIGAKRRSGFGALLGLLFAEGRIAEVFGAIAKEDADHAKLAAATGRADRSVKREEELEAQLKAANARIAELEQAGPASDTSEKDTQIAVLTAEVTALKAQMTDPLLPQLEAYLTQPSVSQRSVLTRTLDETIRGEYEPVEFSRRLVPLMERLGWRRAENLVDPRTGRRARGYTRISV
jgi:hypothetical protein